MADRKLVIVERKLADLIPYARNARTHSDAQVAQIAASIKEFGWTNPVLLDEEDGIIAGHGRVLAGQLLKRKTAPCIVLTGLTPAQRQAYVLADNKLALNAGWNLELLKVELGELKAQGFNLDLVGFSTLELKALLAPPNGLTDPDAAPEPGKAPVARPGDLWLLGRHRLVCGDSTVAGDVSRCLGGARPHLMVTDPPYGVEYDADWRNHTADTGRSDRAVGRVTNDDRADWRQAWHLFPGDVAYVWHADRQSVVVAEGLLVSGFVLRSQIIWSKNNIVVGRGNYHYQHEPCWYAVRKGKNGHWAGDRKQSTLWAIDKPQKSETGHSTQKPVECMKRPIENNSQQGEGVYDPFLGSGTTLIAAEMTGRQCFAVEVSPAYVDVVIQRWEAFTGRKASCEDKSYEELRVSRVIPEPPPGELREASA